MLAWSYMIQTNPPSKDLQVPVILKLKSQDRGMPSTLLHYGEAKNYFNFTEFYKNQVSFTFIENVNTLTSGSHHKDIIEWQRFLCWRTLIEIPTLGIFTYPLLTALIEMFELRQKGQKCVDISVYSRMIRWNETISILLFELFRTIYFVQILI